MPSTAGETVRVAWFSPMPPDRSGVAACSAELVRALSGPEFNIDVFVDASVEPPRSGCRSAHDFLWEHQQKRYDAIVYQLGNSRLHRHIWPYVFRYPGMSVLHDAHLHHARAAALLSAGRKDDYRREFAANHPDTNPDVAELAVAGFNNHLYYYWPMRRLVVERSLLTAVHSPSLARQLKEEMPEAEIETVRLGHGAEVHPDEAAAFRGRIRERHGIAPDAIVFGCFGGLTPDKRLPQILAAFAATRARVPSARLLLAGEVAGHYELETDLDRFGVRRDAVVTGYIEEEADLTAHIAASDVALTLRWPTAREISGPWLRCLAAGVPTITVQLAHLAHVPALDPRTWRPTSVIDDPRGEAVTVAVDILDEDHSLQLAMVRLARNPGLRDQLASAGRRYWRTHHAPELMAADYRRLIAKARSVSAPARSAAEAPAHLVQHGSAALQELLAPFGLPDPLR